MCITHRYMCQYVIRISTELQAILLQLVVVDTNRQNVLPLKSLQE